MNKRDTSLVQRIKENAFYVALGLGLVAILAVVAVYTVEREDASLASNSLDLNTASEYGTLLDKQEEVEATAGKTTKQKNNSFVEDITTQATTEETITTENVTTRMEEVTEETEIPVEQENSLPVTADIEALDFNSEQTLAWPVEGEVLLPYSMETTVYFKTLDQYRCNPGMLIGAGSGTTVTSAYGGQVIQVTSDNEYGNMVTVYLGNDYSVVYGQLDTIYVKEGDYVKQGASIGTIGKPTDSFSQEGSHLFFQMKEKDDVVDPSLFMK